MGIVRTLLSLLEFNRIVGNTMCFGRKNPSRVRYMEQNFSREKRSVLKWVDERLDANEHSWKKKSLRELRILATILLHVGSDPTVTQMTDFRNNLRRFTKRRRRDSIFDCSEFEFKDMEFKDLLWDLGLSDLHYLECHIDLMASMLWSAARERAIIETRRKGRGSQSRSTSTRSSSGGGCYIAFPLKAVEDGDKESLESTFGSPTTEKILPRNPYLTFRARSVAFRCPAEEVPPLPVNRYRDTMAHAENAYSKEKKS